MRRPPWTSRTRSSIGWAATPGSGRSPSTARSGARMSWWRPWKPRAPACPNPRRPEPMWGIVPAAGRGSRIQPLAFSKELLPVGSRLDGGVERPCAVSEYLVERMIRGGADKICFVISPGKSDILEYYGSGYGEAAIAYVVQPQPSGLCDAIFRATPLIA